MSILWKENSRYISRLKQLFNKFHITIFPIIAGFLASIGQIAIIREILIHVNGNELIFALVLTLWLLFVALGTFLYRYFNIRNTSKVVKILHLCLPFILICQYFMIFYWQNKFTLVKGSLLQFHQILIYTSIILLPFCLLTGFLFPLNVANMKKFSFQIHKAYILESSGMLLGAILYFILIYFTQNVQIIFLSALLVLVFLFILFHKKYLLLITFILFIGLIKSNPTFALSQKYIAT